VLLVPLLLLLLLLLQLVQLTLLLVLRSGRHGRGRDRWIKSSSCARCGVWRDNAVDVTTGEKTFRAVRGNEQQPAVSSRPDISAMCRCK
jgi:hypothetical protein